MSEKQATNEKFALLTEENKLLVNRQIEILIASQSSSR